MSLKRGDKSNSSENLEKRNKYLTYLAVFVLLAVMFFVSLFSLRGDSGTVDEVAHIPAGYSYITEWDYRLNPEHPPLAKALAAIPLRFLDLKSFVTDWSWEGINQWEAGWNFLYEQGNDADAMLFWSRLPIVFLLLILGFFIFRWANELYGKKVALFVLVLFVFAPNFIAHGRLVTTDVAAALAFVIAAYYFSKYLTKPTWKTLIFAGLALGIAQLLKFSAFLLFPILFLYLIVKAVVDYAKNNKSFWKQFFQYLKGSILLTFIAYALVWLVYIPLVWNMTPETTHRVIEMNLNPNDPQTLGIRNFFHLFEGNVITRAIGHYLLGLAMVFARTAGGNATFILGHFSDKAIRWYFPVAWFLKTPFAQIILVLGSLVVLFWKKFRNASDFFWTSIFLIPVIVYWAVSIQGRLNIGIRHLLPTVPFVFMFIGRTVYPLFQTKLKQKLIFKIALSFLLLWYVISSSLAYPHYIAYFNELALLKPKYQIIVDSSLDWGQDLKRLADYVHKNHIPEIKVDYFGGGVPSYYMREAREWHSDQGPTTGWIAISATFFQFSKMFGEKEGKWDYSWLESFRPKTIIGGSILVFHITEKDLIEHPPLPRYEIKITPAQAEAKRQKKDVNFLDSNSHKKDNLEEEKVPQL